MENRKTLQELGAEYEKELAVLDKQIRACKAKMRDAGGYERIECGRRLCVLSEMRRDVRPTAETLEHYYDNRLEKREYRTPPYCKHKL